MYRDPLEAARARAATAERRCEDLEEEVARLRVRVAGDASVERSAWPASCRWLQRALWIETVAGLALGAVWLGLGDQNALTVAGIHFVLGALLSFAGAVGLRRGWGWPWALAASLTWCLTLLFPLGLFGVVTLLRRRRLLRAHSV